MATPMTMAEKILARAAGKSSTKAGEFLDCKLDGLMAYQGFVETHHNAQAVGLADGLPQVFDRKKVFLHGALCRIGIVRSNRVEHTLMKG